MNSPILGGLKIIRSQNLCIFDSVQFYTLQADIFHRATIQSENCFERAIPLIALSHLHSLGNSSC